MDKADDEIDQNRVSICSATQVQHIIVIAITNVDNATSLVDLSSI